MINNSAEDLAKSSAEKFVPLGSQFDHRPTTPDLSFSEAKTRLIVDESQQ